MQESSWSFGRGAAELMGLLQRLQDNVEDCLNFELTALIVSEFLAQWLIARGSRKFLTSQTGPHVLQDRSVEPWACKVHDVW